MKRGFIQNSYGQTFSRSGVIKLMARLGFVYKKPKLLPLAANEDGQRDFIRQYNALCNQLMDDEAIVFGDAVHPEHQSRPAHGWFYADRVRQLSPHPAANGSIFTGFSIWKTVCSGLSRRKRSTLKPPASCCKNWKIPIL